jgi:hypothetical protein
MASYFAIMLPERLIMRLKSLADSRGLAVDTFVQETLTEVVEEAQTADEASISVSEVFWRSLSLLPDPDVLLPPYGSAEEAELRRQLADTLSNKISLSQLIIDERDER